MQPYTELANPITTDIDISKPNEIIKKLQQCDAEMFSPLKLDDLSQTLYDDVITAAIADVTKLVKDLVSDESRDRVILMSGCGTSGRIAFMLARTFNRIFPTQLFAYTIAGGDKALFTSQEAPEDDPHTGRKDLIKACADKHKVLYIGITCGLSAPYVAGQLDYCMSHLDVFTPVLLGFNPVRMARNNLIFEWDKTFLNVAEALESLVQEKKAYLINPVLMGEAITGSSRMKGGSITKIVLETIFISATSSLTSFSLSDCKAVLKCYEAASKKFYEVASTVLSSLIESAGKCLTSNGHVYYVGSGGCAILGVIDATECAPTYGSDLNDVRGFIKGGYSQYSNNEGDIGSFGENYRISTYDFAELLSQNDESTFEKSTILITITSSNDAVIEDLKESSELGKYLKRICENKDSTSRVYVVCLLEDGMEAPKLPTYFPNVVMLRFPAQDIIPDKIHSKLTMNGKMLLVQSILECWAKWLYNAVSTGGHLLKGKVFNNYMIDLKVSNQKLFYRSVGIIQKVCHGLSDTEARTFLLRSIYEVDTIDATLMKSSVATHIAVATLKDKIVPAAIIMANKKCGYKEARSILERYHIVRQALAETAIH